MGTELQAWVQEREMELRRQALEEERRRREQVERRLQSESARRQQLVEKEVKMREKQFSQVSGWGLGVGLWGSGWPRVPVLGSGAYSLQGVLPKQDSTWDLLGPEEQGPTRACVSRCVCVCVCGSGLGVWQATL